MTTDTTILNLSGIAKSFDAPMKDAPALLILDDICFTLNSGRSLAVTGKSGCGKSTLLHIAAALERPSSGTVCFQGEDMFLMDDAQRSSVWNQKMGFIFQSNLLLEDFTAVENVMMPAMIAGEHGAGIRNRAMELLDKVGVADRAGHRPDSMSGGERQRVAIARAMMNSPELIFADEPTGSLDEENAAKVEELLLGLVREEGCALLLVTHNSGFAKSCDGVLLLQHRKVEVLR
ncbi:MAG: ABC transporter ATP-binding protein [Sphaerochaetaceae bacterium]|nr:ABC transporter ATP-binding protein [Sphaerochaetaceae bacterium]